MRCLCHILCTICESHTSTLCVFLSCSSPLLFETRSLSDPELTILPCWLARCPSHPPTPISTSAVPGLQTCQLCVGSGNLNWGLRAGKASANPPSHGLPSHRSWFFLLWSFLCLLTFVHSFVYFYFLCMTRFPLPVWVCRKAWRYTSFPSIGLWRHVSSAGRFRTSY